MCESASQRPQRVLRGVALIVGAVFVISVQDVTFKIFSGSLSLWQIFALRGMLAVPMLFGVAWAEGSSPGMFLGALRPWPLLRSFCITMTFLAFYAAIPFLSLSTVGAANYVAPIFVTLLSAYAIGEPVGRLGWTGVILGFVGVLVLLQPGSGAFSPWAGLPVIGAAFYAVSHIITRTRCQFVPTATMAFSLNLMMMMAGLVVSGLLIASDPAEDLVLANPYIFGSWSAVGISEWGVLCLLAGFVIVIGMMVAAAYQSAPPAIVAPFEYVYLVFVAVWDALFFAKPPSGTSTIGIMLIVVAGLMVLRCRQTPKENSLAS